MRCNPWEPADVNSNSNTHFSFLIAFQSKLKMHVLTHMKIFSEGLVLGLKVGF